MSPTFSKFSAGLPAIWLLLAIFFNAYSAAAATYPYTVYRGTFIHLPRINSSSTKSSLVRNQGVIWVSLSDGRIKGYDWGVHDENSFQSFLSSHNWTDANNNNNDNNRNSQTQVNVVKSNDGQNEFFFPGFIGMCSIN